MRSAKSENAGQVRGAASGNRRGRIRRAFTLIELVVVLTLIVALSLLAMPAIENIMIGSNLPESAGRVRSLLAMARSGAVSEARRVRVRFLPNQQQPIVEIERDPIFQPGLYEQITAAWTQEPILLGDVQVHSVALGRPEFLKPVSDDVDPRSDSSDAATDGATQADVSNVRETGETLSLRTAVEEEEVDINRPSIIFEPDGSTDWAMITVSQVMPGEEVPDGADQRWIIVDGRTGMITIRTALSAEELADPTLYVQREKLALPDLAELTDNPLSFAGPGRGMPTDDSSLPGDGSDLFGAGSGFASGSGSASGFSSSGGESKTKDETAGGRNPGQPERASRPGSNGQVGDLRPSRQERRGGNPSKNTGNTGDTQQQLEQKLSNSNLTDEEKKNIMDTLGGGRRGR